jgi:NAD(P)H dehydrogenase (quinone)
MSTLIIGGTGTIGRPLLSALAGRADTTALVNTDTDAAIAAEHGAAVLRGDLSDPSSLESAFAGVERLFLLTPFVEGQAALEHAALDAAERAGVAHIVKFAYAGIDWPIAITAAHREIRTRLDTGSTPYTLLLADVFAANLLAQADLLAAGQLVLPARNARIAYVDPTDVGEVAASILTAEQPTTGTVVVTGPQLLGNDDVAAIASRVLGRDVTYIEVEASPWSASLQVAGWPGFIADAVAEMHTTIAEAGPLPVSDTTQRVLGRPGRTLEQFLSRSLQTS